MLTVRPVEYCAAGAGDWLKTWPFGALLEAGSWFTLNPAAVMAAVALSAVMPMTFGTAAGTPAAIVPAGAVPVAAPMEEAPAGVPTPLMLVVPGAAGLPPVFTVALPGGLEVPPRLDSR